MKIIYVPCKDEEEARSIGKQVVEKKLAFCANVIPRIYSYYFLENKVQEDTEALLLLKTHSEFDLVKNEIEKLHSYDTPAILKIPIEKVNEKYNDWSKQVNSDE